MADSGGVLPSMLQLLSSSLAIFVDSTEQTLPKDEGDANTVKLFWLARLRGCERLTGKR